MKHLIVIAGPTASGKTDLSVKLAKQLNAEIISADSRQFYKEISIGTAKPSVEEMKGVIHHFIDSHSLEVELTSAQFAKDAKPTLDRLFKTHEYVILTGGSGMYIDALCYGLDEIPTDKSIQTEVLEDLANKGIDFLLEELEVKDTITFNTIDRSNQRRVVRAIEAIRITGQKLSELQNKKPKESIYKIDLFVINHSRERLYERINDRVDSMIKNGLVEEVKSVKHLKNLRSLNTVGYKELFDYLEGKVSLEEAINTIKQNTRRYAKRQLTWFRRYEDAHWIEYSDTAEMMEEILKILNESSS